MTLNRRGVTACIVCPRLRSDEPYLLRLTSMSLSRLLFFAGHSPAPPPHSASTLGIFQWLVTPLEISAGDDESGRCQAQEDRILPLRRPASCTTMWGLSAMRQKVNDITQNLAGPDPNLPLPQRDMAPLNDGCCSLPASQLSKRGCACRTIVSLALLPPTDHMQPPFSHSTLVSTAFTRPRHRLRHPHGFVDVSFDHHIYPYFVQVNAPVTRSTLPAAHSASPCTDNMSQTLSSSKQQRRDSEWWRQSQFRCLG